MGFHSAKKNWEGLAQKDPLWAICTDPQKKGRKWDLDDFFKIGKLEVDTIMDLLKQKHWYPLDFKNALDFGCGAGRLSRALASHFEHVTGVDVSPTMIQNAKELNHHLLEKILFVLNENPDLASFDTNYFSFILTTIVLQHIPFPESAIYIKEMARVLKPGGILVFQIPTDKKQNKGYISKLRTKLKLRERLALIGFGKGFQMEMNIISEKEILSILENSNTEILGILTTNHTDPSFNGNLTFTNNIEVDQQYLSRMFIVRKLSQK